jgi:hypothetical protein
MKVRVLAPALLLSLIAAPAVAQRAPVPPQAPALSADAAAKLLADPATQDVLALQIAGLAGIVLDTRVGPLASLADPRDGVRPDDTIRSVQRRRDPEFDRHLYEGSRRAVASAGAVAGEAAELQRTAQRLRAALAPLIAAAGG